jgi:glycosyltransferase involved in cell wall biosynthesis
MRRLGLIRRIAPSRVPESDVLAPERIEGSLRIGYVVWDWPALSQTFVLNELRQLLAAGHDVVVYYMVPADQPAEVDFPIEVHQVGDHEHLVRLLREHGRQVMHSPFAYPSTTRLVWPAAQATGVPFTFMAGGVDVAHYENMKRNRVGEVASSPECLGVITLGSFHRRLLIDCGVPESAIVMERQSAWLPEYAAGTGGGDRPVISSIGRFIEKKGLEYLIRAAVMVPEADVRIYGYGPLGDQLEQLATDLGATNVSFPGALQGSAPLRAAYVGSDVFVLPCVRAENGDLDGLPTVLLEAMGAGTPVVTTDAANIPDLVIDGVTGFVAEQRDVDGLVAAIRRSLSMTADRRAAMTAAARSFAEVYSSPTRTVDTLVRLWRRDALDIVLVTYDRKGYRNLDDTVDIIERVYRYTSLPFTLTVVDNRSDASFVRALDRRFGDRPGFRLVPLAENVFCGPASNIGFARGRAPYLVYLCSNEGFVLRSGWDHQLVRALERSGAAMGGQQVELARHSTGSTMAEYPSFAEWRTQGFALENPSRRFRHVQGGLFVLRRDVFEAVGGFNPKVPQGGMDVEFSYHLEALGHALTDIPGVIGISAKTRPALLTLMDEFTVAVHPSGHSTVAGLDDVVSRAVRLCPVCTWVGESFDGEDDESLCPGCGARPFSRSVWRVLSHSGQLQSRPAAAIVSRDPSVASAMKGLSTRLTSRTPTTGGELEALVDCLAEEPALVVVDRYWETAEEFAPAAAALAAHVRRGGLAVVGLPLHGTDGTLDDLLGLGDVIRLVSGVCRFDPYPVLAAGFPWPLRDLQGLEC